ncbi:MAG TPA: hypothetical protein ENK59_05210 [Thioploca sp.]|nr:hypothetical protein [Thioploca sp.]
MLLNDYQVKKLQNYKAVVERLSQLKTIANQSQWTDRAIEIQRVREQLQAKLWQANTKGLAQATFQQWLRTVSKQMNIKRLQVDPTLNVAKYTDVWQVTAKLRGQFNKQDLTKLLLEIANHPSIVVTEMLDVYESRDQLKFVIILKAYFRKIPNLPANKI